MGKPHALKRTSATGGSSKKVKDKIIKVIKKIVDDIPECKDCASKVIKAIGERMEIDSMSCYPVGVRVTEIVRPTRVGRVIPSPGPIPIEEIITPPPPPPPPPIIIKPVTITGMRVNEGHQMNEYKYGSPYDIVELHIPGDHPVLEKFPRAGRLPWYPGIGEFKPTFRGVTEAERLSYKQDPSKWLIFYTGIGG